MSQTQLSVNINKIATLRNARGGDRPNVVQSALDIERFGAQGITVHPRPDERHIRYADVRELAPILHTEFNVEGYPNAAFIDLVLATKPHQVTLVPDAPDVLTSNAGWDTLKYKDLLTDAVAAFRKEGIRVSLFIDPNEDLIAGAKRTGADRVELYTEHYASQYAIGNKKAVEPYANAAAFAHEIELGVNAGHDLDLSNLRYFATHVPHLAEVSIGHALISDALYFGLENTVNMYKRELRPE